MNVDIEHCLVSDCSKLRYTASKSYNHDTTSGILGLKIQSKVVPGFRKCYRNLERPYLRR